MAPDKNAICPCQRQQGQPKLYSQCCKPLHDGAPATSAKQLMASRFSAFVLGLTEYLIATWHSSTCPKDLSTEPDEQWLKLDILSFDHNTVHFKAYFKQEGQFEYLEESSNFVQENNRLVYLDGRTKFRPANLNRNDQCLCGSGKKFKQCCQK